jgi:hypothetical protein
VVGEGGSTTGVEQRGAGEGIDMWDPRVSGRGERRRFCAEDAIPKRKHILRNTPRASARARWADKGGGGLWGRWASAVKLGRLGRIPGGNSIESLIFEFQMNLDFGQDFENFHKEI